MSDDEIAKDFLVESCENLDRLDRDLVGLEKNPQDREVLGGHEWLLGVQQAGKVARPRKPSDALTRRPTDP